MSDQITLDEAIEAFSQIRDRARARQLLSVAFIYATDYMISWDEFESLVASLKKWHLDEG